MKNITKILFSLFLSLSVIQSANAGEMSVTGSAQATYVITSSDSATSQVEKKPGIGLSNELAFNADGEFGNGYTWNYQVELDSDQRNGAAINDDTRLELGTPYGTIGIYNSEGDLNTHLASAVSAYNPGYDIGTTGGYEGGTGINSYSNLQYHLPSDLLPFGITAKAAYSTGTGYGGDANDAGKNQKKDGVESFQVKAAPMDGLTVGASYLEKKGTSTAGVVAHNYETGGLYAKYSIDAFSFGVGKHGVAPTTSAAASGTCAATTAVKTYTTSVSSTTGLPSKTTAYCAGTKSFENDTYSAAYLVNENLSISVDKLKSTANVHNMSILGVRTETDRDLTIDNIQAAYNIGGAVVAIGQKKVDGMNYAEGIKLKETVFSLKMEF
jgi:hypothetical protein